MASGFDWSNMITQLMNLERKPISLMETGKTTVSARYDAWKTINTKLLSLKTAAQSLSGTDDFNLYTSNSSITGTSSSVNDFLNYSIGSNASQGSYTMKIDNLAQAQKLGSKSFGSLEDALGISGDLVIKGRAITIETTSTLADIKNKINDLNSGSNPAGVTASIITVGQGEYRLNLTSNNTGLKGIDIANGSSTDVLGLLGLADNTTSLKNAITGGAQSARFTSSTQGIKDMLGIGSGESNNVTIAGQSIAMNLATDSLQSIRDRINSNGALQALGVSSSVVSEIDSGTTYYRLQIDGTQALVDAGNSNIMKTLGFLKQGNSDVSGLIGDKVNTADGQIITAENLIIDIDGYNTFTPGDTITIEGARHDGTGVGPMDFTITSTSTMQDLLDAVKTAYGDEISAYINGNGAIVVEDSLSGASSLALSLAAGIADGNSSLDLGTLNSAAIRKRQIVAGEDAQISLDGSTITRSTNQITDVIAGVTLNLRKEDIDAEITLDITRDNAAAKSKIADFVKGYNDIITFINSQFTYSKDDNDSSGKAVTTPPLFGDSGLLSVRSSIKNVILSGVTGMSSTLDHLSLIGVNLDKDGMLAIDNAKLDGYLSSNFNDIINLFSARGTSTNGNLSFVSSTSATQEGSYEFDITQAATKANTLGAGFNGSLSAPTTISITDNAGQEARISLSAGWGISSIVNAINSELSMEYEKTLVGANSYYADALQGSVITEETTLNSLYKGDGTSANLANGDTIEFTGTDRVGVVKIGSFTITDTSTDSVGDFLSTIEEAFGAGYNAYIDSQGRIAIKNTEAGDSSLTLNITAVKDLDFGAVDVDATGADGSHAGRYSMEVVAENEGGQLKISNKDYGDNHFDIAVTGGNLGITNGTYTGNDVAGRIREEGSSTWMTATGSGRTLTVDDDQDAEGLVINYAGTGIGAFDFDFITGIGEKMDRAMFYMTDSAEGFISDRQKSLENQMKSFDQKISDAEERISKKEQTLIAKFVAMEKLISQLNAQQQRLESQISSLSS